MFFKFIKNKKAAVLLIAYLVIALLLVLGIGYSARSVVETRLAERQKRAVQCFYFAEAGLERAIYDLREDFQSDPSSPSWTDGDINGITCGPDTAEFYTLPYASTTIGDGYYVVELKNVSGETEEIWVRSRGILGDTTKTLQAYLKAEDVSLWRHVIFAGAGASGATINGNVDIRGSVHILGDGLSSSDFAMNMGGDGNVGNNYIGIPVEPAGKEQDEGLKGKIPPCPTVVFAEETVESLSATLRVRRGVVGLSGSSIVGDPNIPENEYKETVDGTYVTDGFGGNQGESSVFSDNGTDNLYDMGDSVKFPSLSDPYSAADPTYSYQEYLYDNALVISEAGALAQMAGITPTSSFSYGNANGSISMDGAGNLTINGIVYIDGGNFNISMQGNERTINYTGSGSIFVSGNVGIGANLLTPYTAGTPTFPTNILGIMTPGNIIFSGAQIDVMGVFYAENSIIATQQTDVAGTFASNYFDMGLQVPSIYQVPAVADNLPAGMISQDPFWVIRVISWQKL